MYVDVCAGEEFRDRPGKTMWAADDKPRFKLAPDHEKKGAVRIEISGECHAGSGDGDQYPFYNRAFKVCLTMEDLQSLMSFALQQDLLSFNARVVGPNNR